MVVLSATTSELHLSKGVPKAPHLEEGGSTFEAVARARGSTEVNRTGIVEERGVPPLLWVGGAVQSLWW